MPQDTKTIVKIVLDFVLLLTVGIPILIFHLCGKPKQRGFFCDDDSIKYPFRPSTISSNALYVVGIFLPVIVISLTEFANESRAKRRNRGHVRMLFGRTVPKVVWNIYTKIGLFLFGACMSQLTTDIAKYSIGRLRPHFWDVCHPDVNCSLLSDPHEYIESFKCLKPDVNVIREARLSFPSGHSSFSAYTMIYTVMYLQSCMQCKVNRLLKPFLQFLLVMMTWYTALSRVGDYKHHWSDVMIGWLQGVIVALITAFFVSDFFTKRKKENEDIVLQNITSDVPAANYNSMKSSETEQHQ